MNTRISKPGACMLCCVCSLWRPNDLVNYPDGDLYLGSNVVREWTAQGCELDRSGAPIVEMDGSAGTAGGHFDETCFDEELYVHKAP